MTAPLLDITGLKVHLHVGERIVRAVDGVDLQVAHGTCVGVVGESGSGKSTLARAAARLLPNLPATISGTAQFEGRDLLGMNERALRGLRRRHGFSMIFQDPLGYLNPTQRIGAQIGEALSDEDGAKTPRIAALLDEVGLAGARDIVRRYPHELSGGMRQRVMIAIALASAPKLLFADEPTTALDVTVQLQVLQALYRLHRERQMAIVIITHDLAVVAEICDACHVMQSGRVVESGPTASLFANPQHPYTARLLELSRRRAGVRP